jgi:hypothetical protein
MELSRRDLLDLAARAALLPGATEFFSTWLRAAEDHHGQSAPPEPPLLRNYQPKFFSHDDFEALQAYTEILIPTDDTPGAREAHCAHYIDFVLQAAVDQQKAWSDAMSALREAGFHAANAQGRVGIVDAMSKEGHRAFHLIKQQSTFAFYTSRAGMIEALDYKGNSYNATFPACTHPEHHKV